MCSVKSLIIFDFPLQAEYISEQFANTHQRLQTEQPGWSTLATRQKLIAQYWFSYVLQHFSILIGIPLLLVFLFNSIVHSEFYILSLLIAGFLSYPIMYIFHYRKNFSSLFLPRLETVKEAYERRQIQNLEKCRQAQLSNFSLTLFFYVLALMNRMESLKCDDYSANLLMRLYGVDQGSMKKNLELIMATSKRKNLSSRKITEIKNRFNETYEFLEELQFPAAIQKLREIESKFFNN